MEALTAYLREMAGRPGGWGSCDCFLFVAGWVERRIGRDPAARYRGRYRTERGAFRHIAKAGGFLPLVETCMTEAGLTKTESPAVGDIGLLDAIGGPTLAIRSEGFWIGKAPAGVRVIHSPVVAAWGVPCRS